VITFNEWRHRQTRYDREMSAARTPEAKRRVMEKFALQAMQLAYANGDRQFAAQVMEWALSKRLLTDEQLKKEAA
jgi:hypothetical protein